MWTQSMTNLNEAELMAATVDPHMALIAAAVVLLVAAGVFIARNFRKTDDKQERKVQWNNEGSKK